MDWVKQKMAYARQQRELLQRKSHTNIDQSSATSHTSQTGARKKPFNKILLLGAATAWVVTIIVAWMAGFNVTTFDVSSHDPGNVGEIRVSRDAELKNRITTSIQLRKRLDEENGHIQLLTDSMPDSASRLSSVDQQQLSATDEETVIEMIHMIEPTAAGTPDTLAVANTGVVQSTVEGAGKPGVDETNASVPATLAVANTEVEKSAVDSTAKHEVMENDAPVSDKPDSVNNAASSPWVVNLVSLSSKADADQFAAKARSKNVQVEQHAATVKGKHYWRVQVGGFSTAADARSQSHIIKEKLGLKDVWITKR